MGYGELQSMSEMQMNEAAFAMVTSVLFFGHIAFKVPSNLLLLRIGEAATLTRMTVLWGPGRCVDDVRAERILAVCAAVPAGLMRGGTCSRRAVSELLVSKPSPRSRNEFVAGGDFAVGPDRARDRRRDHGGDGRSLGHSRLVAFHAPALPGLRQQPQLLRPSDRECPHQKPRL
jgi:hypothetical protein